MQIKKDYKDERLRAFLSRIQVLHSAYRLLPKGLGKSVYNNVFGILFEDKTVNNFKLSANQRKIVMNLLREDLKKLNVQSGFDIGPWDIKV